MRLRFPPSLEATTKSEQFFKMLLNSSQQDGIKHGDSSIFGQTISRLVWISKKKDNIQNQSEFQ